MCVCLHPFLVIEVIDIHETNLANDSIRPTHPTNGVVKPINCMVLPTKRDEEHTVPLHLVIFKSSMCVVFLRHTLFLIFNIVDTPHKLTRTCFYDNLIAYFFFHQCVCHG